jgi:hypothetical protein
MAVASLRWIVETEALCAVTLGVVGVLTPNVASAWFALPEVPASWAMIRLCAVLLLSFGMLLHVATEYVLAHRTVVQALGIIHGSVAVVIGLQAFAVWSTGYAAFVAFVPFALGVRYAQYGYWSKDWAQGLPDAVST